MPTLDLTRPGTAAAPPPRGEFDGGRYGLGLGQRVAVRTRAALGRAAGALLAARRSAPAAVRPPAARRPN